MSLKQKIAYTATGVLLILVAVGMLLPPVAHVERHIQIEAPAASVFALVNDFRRFNEWSPWAATDPNALYTISGPTRGLGATIVWNGQIVGQGSQVIIESVPHQRVTNRLDLGGEGEILSTFVLTRAETGTSVSWSFDNEFGWNLFGRYFGLMLDGIIGSNYEAGLKSLKAMAERLPPADFSDIEIEHRNITAMDIAYLPTSSAPEAAAISKALGDAYFELLSFMDRHNLQEAGAPMSISGLFAGSELQFDAAIPIRGEGVNLPLDGPGVKIGKSYEGRVVRVKHVGAYRNLGQTHDKIAAYLAALGIRQNGKNWESYVSDPTRVAEEELLTFVYYPIVED